MYRNVGFDQVRRKFLEQKAKKNGTVIISEVHGNVLHVPDKELLLVVQPKAD